MSFLACMPLIEPDIPAVLSLDQRCFGGLWTRSGYLKELDSDHSDLLVLLSATRSLAFSDRTLNATPSKWAATEPSTTEPSTTEPSTTEPSTINKMAEKDAIQLFGIGCLWAILEEAHITTLAIEPTQQRQKLGQLLLSELLLQGSRRGLTRATLEVRVSNQKALRLYQAFGFREAGRRRRYYSDGEDARVLWRSGLQENSFVHQIMKKRTAAIAQLTRAGHQYLSLISN